MYRIIAIIELRQNYLDSHKRMEKTLIYDLKPGANEMSCD